MTDELSPLTLARAIAYAVEGRSGLRQRALQMMAPVHGCRVDPSDQAGAFQRACRDNWDDALNRALAEEVNDGPFDGHSISLYAIGQEEA